MKTQVSRSIFQIFHICINYVDTTKFALGDGDHNVSSLKKAGCIPTLVKPPLPLKGMYSLRVCVCVCVCTMLGLRFQHDFVVHALIIFNLHRAW